MTYSYYARMSGLDLRYRFLYEDTARYLRNYEIDKPISTDLTEISVKTYEFDEWRRAGNQIDGFAEFCLLCEETSQYLLSYERCVFHSVALSFRGNAWLITAGSGVGKSTQCHNLVHLSPDEISVINGDKPILECRQSKEIVVHPSPWNGKEGWHGAPAASLAGIIVLKRGSEDKISPLEPRHGVPWIYSSVFQSWQDKKSLQMAAIMTEKIVQRVPMWILSSYNPLESTQLVFQTMCNESESL